LRDFADSYNRGEFKRLIEGDQIYSRNYYEFYKNKKGSRSKGQQDKHI
jgi:hypothetical protein